MCLSKHFIKAIFWDGLWVQIWKIWQNDGGFADGHWFVMRNKTAKKPFDREFLSSIERIMRRKSPRFRKSFQRKWRKENLDCEHLVHKVNFYGCYSMNSYCKRKKSVKAGKKCPGPLDGSRGISIIGVVPVEKSGTPAPKRPGARWRIWRCAWVMLRSITLTERESVPGQTL